jgi:hypothetical protein
MSLLDTASLIVTPNGYKEGTLYSVIPSDGSGDMSVVRATTATRVNSAGLVELVPYNLFNYSQKFDNAYWINSNSNVTADNITAPDGTITADKMTITSGFGAVFASSIPLEGTHTISCFFKKGDASSVYIDTNGTSGNIFGSLNLDTLATSSVGGAIVNVENAGNGWYRLSITASFTGTTSYIAFGILSASSNLFTYLWGAQLVEGSTAKDYQKTETRLNIPRLDYSNGTCPSLLVEPQRTNLAWYSENFGGGGWSISSGAITDNATTAPNGVNSADLYTANGTLNNHDFFQGFTGGSATTSTIYVKKNTAQFVYISLNYQSSGVNWATGIYDLDNLTTATFQSGGVTNQIATISDAGNGWRRITLSVSTANTALFCMYGVSDSMSPSLTARGRVENSSTASFYAWGAQFEIGSYATSYIQTGLGSVTRNADVVSKTGISSLIGQTEGTMFLDVDFTEVSDYNGWFMKDVANFDTFAFIQRENTGIIAVGYYGSGALQARIETAPSQPIGRYKIGFGYKNNDFVLYINGTQIGTDTSGSVSGLMNFLDAHYSSTGSTLQNAIALWKTRLTNTQLAQLTTI